jgi:hypothetical protein
MYFKIWHTNTHIEYDTADFFIVPSSFQLLSSPENVPEYSMLLLQYTEAHDEISGDW